MGRVIFSGLFFGPICGWVSELIDMYRPDICNNIGGGGGFCIIFRGPNLPVCGGADLVRCTDPHHPTSFPLTVGWP